MAIGSCRLDRDLVRWERCRLTYQEDGDPREAYVVEGDGPVVGVEPLGLARVEVLIPVDAVRLFGDKEFLGFPQMPMKLNDHFYCSFQQKLVIIAE